jgi:hypothetical protein
MPIFSISLSSPPSPSSPSYPSGIIEANDIRQVYLSNITALNINTTGTLFSGSVLNADTISVENCTCWSVFETDNSLNISNVVFRNVSAGKILLVSFSP